MAGIRLSIREDVLLESTEEELKELQLPGPPELPNYQVEVPAGREPPVATHGRKINTKVGPSQLMHAGSGLVSGRVAV